MACFETLSFPVLDIDYSKNEKRLTEKRGHGGGGGGFDPLLISRDRRRPRSLLFRGDRGQLLGIREHAVARRFLTRWHRQLSNDHALVGQPPRIRDQKRGLLLLHLIRPSLLHRPRFVLPGGGLCRPSGFILLPSTHLLDPDRSLLPRATLFSRRRILPRILRADLFEKGRR